MAETSGGGHDSYVEPRHEVLGSTSYPNKFAGDGSQPYSSSELESQLPPVELPANNRGYR